jgi:hypothetical protein
MAESYETHAMNENEKIRLTIELHRLLIKKGYCFFSIDDVEYTRDGTSLTSCTVRAIKELPHSINKSCTGIEDGMITSLINGDAKEIAIYLIHDGELLS